MGDHGLWGAYFDSRKASAKMIPSVLNVMMRPLGPSLVDVVVSVAFVPGMFNRSKPLATWVTTMCVSAMDMYAFKGDH